MKNTALHIEMASEYTRAAATHNYILTFKYAGNVWAVCLHNVNATELYGMTKLNRASRNGGAALRFRPNKADKIALLANGGRVLCSVEYFNNLYNASKYNRGEIAEMLVTEKMFNQKWHKDSTPFTVDGDISEGREKWQHKHESATFCNERTLRKAAR